MLVEDGTLVGSNDHWELRAPAKVVASPTIEAILAARLDRLDPAIQEVIQCASVIGEECWPAPASVELLPPAVAGELDTHLATLTRSELIRQGRTLLDREDAFRFGHILIRDVVYARMLKDRGASLHGVFADWLDERAGEWLGEYESIVGYHLEQAYRYRRELGKLDEVGWELGRRAAHYLAIANRKALGRGDMSAGASVLGRAADLLSGESDRVDLLSDLDFALTEVGDLSQAEAILDDAVGQARATGNVMLVSARRGGERLGAVPSIRQQ